MKAKRSSVVNVQIVGVEAEDVSPFEPAKPTKTERKGWNKKEATEENEKQDVINAGGFEIIVSKKDAERIAMRREQEEKKKEDELLKNYDEYNQYMRMIGNMLDKQDSGPHGSNNERHSEPQ
jgi:hypothetical protein